jgi:hypothetical protein
MLIPLMALGEWAHIHMEAMDAARARFDGR